MDSRAVITIQVSNFIDIVVIAVIACLEFSIASPKTRFYLHKSIVSINLFKIITVISNLFADFAPMLFLHILEFF